MLALAVIGDLILIFRHRLNRRIIIMRDEDNEKRPSKTRHLTLVFQILIFSLQQYPYFEYNDPVLNPVGLLTSTTFLKIIFIFKVIIHFSKFSSEQATRVWKFMGIRKDSYLLLKLEIKKRPVRFLLFSFAVSIAIFGIMLEIYE